ncbi:14620_t:CDS:2, partial [Gigaspora margarita]
FLREEGHEEPDGSQERSRQKELETESCASKEKQTPQARQQKINTTSPNDERQTLQKTYTTNSVMKNKLHKPSDERQTPQTTATKALKSETVMILKIENKSHLLLDQDLKNENLAFATSLKEKYSYCQAQNEGKAITE